ncbi:MAG TPA: hypothetical protein H9763_05845 [Candidatus Eisenbergiella merdigallinarum]|uniref:Stage II sporulation protein M n=1 Tax=Candidatus Eisenbergiella merdigallinarum TaxID=2838552 RepID=A0A9D2MQD0_9FIRM|nr:hypothetical protein [Candidatus Eisenbergiella merdigallinarum]
MILFLTGFLAGIAAICLFSDPLMESTGFLDPSLWTRMQLLEINRNGLLLYSLRQRLGAAAFLVLLATAGAGEIGAAGFLFFGGLSAGAVLTTLSARYGLGGILLFSGCVLPHQLLLVPGFLLLLDWCARKLEKRKLLIPLAVVITGCLLESYVNPIALKVVTGLLFSR